MSAADHQSIRSDEIIYVSDYIPAVNDIEVLAQFKENVHQASYLYFLFVLYFPFSN